MQFSDLQTANWLVVPALTLPVPPLRTVDPPSVSVAAHVRPPVLGGVDLGNQVWSFVLSGVAIVSGEGGHAFSGTIPYDWRRDRLVIPRSEWPALDFVFAHYGIAVPDPRRYLPVLSLQPGGWSAVVSVNSFLHAPHPDEYDDDQPYVPDGPTVGVAVDSWALAPFLALSDPSGVPVPNAYDGLIADIAVYGAATLHRISFQVHLLAKIAFAG